MTIFRDHHYQDDRGRVVIEREIVEGEPPEEFSRFGAPVHNIPVAKNEKGQVVTVNGVIAIDAADVVEAFRKYEETVEAGAKAMQQAAVKQVTAPKLVMPNGRM